MFKAMLKQEIGWYDRKDNGVGALCARLSGEAALVQGVSMNSISILNYMPSTKALQATTFIK